MENEQLRFSEEAREAIRSGFASDDAFDAILGLIAMLRIIQGQHICAVPSDSHVRALKGGSWDRQILIEDRTAQKKSREHIAGFQINLYYRLLNMYTARQKFQLPNGGSDYGQEVFSTSR